MSTMGQADLAVRIVTTLAQADQSVFVVNAQVVAGSPTSGDVAVVQADGTLAWGASTGEAALAVIRRNSLAMTAVVG